MWKILKKENGKYHQVTQSAKMKKALAIIGLVVLGTTACNNNEEVLQPSIQPSTQPTEETFQLSLDLESTYELNESEAKALAYDNLNGTGKPTLSTSNQDWTTHLFIRNSRGTGQFYAAVNWRTIGREGGKIKLESLKDNSKHTVLSLSSSGITLPARPKKGETWYIAGIMGGGKLNDLRTEVRFDDKEAVDANKARVPYAFKWTPFVVGDIHKPTKLTVHFKPQGVQFSVKADQWQGKVHRSLLPKARIISNALTQRGKFNYALTAGRQQNGGMPQFAYDLDLTATSVDTLQAQMGIHGNLLSTVLWAMPKEGRVAPQDPKTRPCVLGYIVDKRGTTTEHGLRTGIFTRGKSYEVELSVFRPRLPLELVAEYNLAGPNGTSFLNTHHRTSNKTHYFTHARSRGFQQQKIGDKAWKLPNFGDIRAFFIDRQVEIRKSQYGRIIVDNRAKTITSNPGNALTLFGVPMGTSALKSEYIFSRTDNVSGYALRMLDANSGNIHKVAYRYQILRDGAAPRLRITARYLGGNSPESSILDVASANYWNANQNNDVQRSFPLWGFYKSPTNRDVTDAGEYGDYWYDTPDQTFFQIFDKAQPIGEWFIPGGGQQGGTLLMPVRLMRTFCCELDDTKVSH